MNVLIDREKLIILRKMEHSATLSKLATIEQPDIHVLIIPADNSNCFGTLTDLELKMLIKNTNGPDVRSVFSRDALCQILFLMIQQLPLSTANAFEVDLQWRNIPVNDVRRYKYVPGSTQPQLAHGLTEHAALLYAAKPQASPASALPAVPQGVVAAPAVSAPAPVATQQGDEAFSMPKAGTNTHTIFAFCHERWKEANYTEDTRTLDSIRKLAVDKLVPRGLNISTVRTQAARWNQNRHAVVI